jgi:hypothetical protein
VVWWPTYQTTGEAMMTLFEGVVVANLLVSVFLAYKVGKLTADIEILYQGVAGLFDDEDTT